MIDTASKQVKSNLRAVPEEHWKDLALRERSEICDRSLAQLHPPEGLTIRFLHMDLLVGIENRRLRQMHHGHWHDLAHPLIELMTLVYLLNAAPVSPGDDLISVNELKDALFFRGAHALPTAPLLSRFGNDLRDLKWRAKN